MSWRGVPSTIAFSGDRGDEPRRTLGVAPFEDGQYVRLLNRARGGYLSADESGDGVSIRRRRELANTAWLVQIVDTGGDYGLHAVLLGACGRHLSAAPTHPPHDDHGYIGPLTTQRLFDTVQETHAMWRTFQRFDGDSDVLLLNEISPTGLVRALRANGRYSRWHRRVSQQPIDRYEPRFSSMMVWEVQVIPMSVQRPPYQLRNAARCLCFGQRRQGTGRIQVSVRVANHEGNYNDPREATFSLPGTGRSLIELERRFGCFNNDQPVSIFIRAGTHGQLFPLLTDLPSGLGNFKLVVFRAGTPGHDRLRFPDILAA